MQRSQNYFDVVNLFKNVLFRFVIRADVDKPKSEPVLKIEDLRLPSQIFATEGEEEEVGMLNKAAPRSVVVVFIVSSTSRGSNHLPHDSRYYDLTTR